MPKIIEGKIIAKGMRFGIVASRFNDFISGRLIEGAVDALTRAGAEEKEIQIVRVPGAFELPIAAKKMAKSGRFVSKGIASVGLETEVPVAFGVLTTDTIEQAIERAGTKAGNKGWDAAMCAIEMVDLFKKL